MSIEVVTFGCRLNAAESEAMRVQAQAAGHRDLVIINTCSVTNEASRQARQTIRRLHRERPDARIVVTGCAAQIEPTLFSAMPEVAGVIGNAEKTGAEVWTALRSQEDTASSKPVFVGDIMTSQAPAPVAIDRLEGRVRVFVPVQTGCDHRCTFCIIPYGRGPSRSVPMGAVVEQMRRLVESGVKEAVLTGVDITSYGADLPGAPTLGRLVKAILKHVPELPRLRLSSIDQVEADPDLLDAFGEEPRLMPHLHLSLQAGDDLTLKRMKRRHLREDAIRFCETLRRLRPDIVFGADIIAGFPTETEDMFTRSLDLIEECGLTYIHAFPFSPRAGTPAARMPQVPGSEVKARARRLREKAAQALNVYLKAQVGTRQRVLVENTGLGHAEGFATVRYETQPSPGQVVETFITGCENTLLIGKEE